VQAKWRTETPANVQSILGSRGQRRWIIRMDHDGKLIEWAQAGVGQGQTGCMVQALQAVSDNEL